MEFAIISALVSAGSGALSEWIQSSADEKERQARLEALQEYAAISPPEVKDLVAQEVKHSAFADINPDARQRAIQDETQAALLGRGRAGGLDFQGRARLEEARQDAGQYEQQQRQGILANARARGIAGSGEELAAQLQAQQAGADRERMAGVSAAADADEAALQSMLQAGTMARQREDSDFAQQAQVASAQDEIDMFNAGENNKFSIYNSQQRQQNFDNQMALANARNNVRLGQAAQEGRIGERQAGAVGGAGQALGYGLASYGQYRSQQQPVQTQPARAATPQEAQAPGTIGASAALNPALQQQALPTRRKAR